MKALEILFNRRWVLKSEDKDLYYQIRDAVGEVRKYTTEKLGCQIIDNSMLVKMEKIPVIPETFMGIQSFTSKEEYVYLCILLMFLEDKDAQEQFVLSQLTEYMTAVMPGEITDWKWMLRLSACAKGTVFAPGISGAGWEIGWPGSQNLVSRCPAGGGRVCNAGGETEGLVGHHENRRVRGCGG